MYKGSEITNINVTQEGTTLDLVFLDRDASFNNSFGYYYYKTSDGVSNSNMRKYIVFPNVAFSVYNGALSILKCGDKYVCSFGVRMVNQVKNFRKDIQ